MANLARLTLLLVAMMACSRPHPDAPKIVADPIGRRADSTPALSPSESIVDSGVDAAIDAAKDAVVVDPKPAYCENDSACAFDDPCDAHACVGKSEAKPVACEESAPRPGRCVCASNHCTLVRKDPATGARKTGCTSNATCELDPPTGSCRAGKGARSLPTGGVFCACDAGTCTPEWVGEVTCKTSKDCSWLDDPWRPAPAAKVPRPFPPVVPCKTGEKDSVCSAGVCVLRAWKC